MMQVNNQEQFLFRWTGWSRAAWPANLLENALDAIPQPVLIVDPDIRVLGLNGRAAELLNCPRDEALYQWGGELLRCLRHRDPGGCGHSPACRKCVIRSSVAEAFQGRDVRRKFARMQIRPRQGKRVSLDILVTASALGDGQALVLLEGITELLALRDLLPVCCSCRAVRKEDNSWQKMEHYLETDLKLKLTHGICPDCVRRLYPEEAERVLQAKPRRKT